MEEKKENSKVVTLENLGTFKAEMDKSVDAKVAAGGGGTALECATEADILALFADPAENEPAE